MVTGATSLSLVRDELFATMEQAEQGLEQFIAERQNGSLLQHAVECLQQIRGTLNLIELAGAELLAQEALQLATDIPTGVSEERDGQLAALATPCTCCAATWRTSRPIARRSPSCSCRRSTKCAVRRAAGAAGKLLLQRPPGYPAAAEHCHRPPAFRSRTGRGKPADAPHVPDRPARPDPRTEPLSQPQADGPRAGAPRQSARRGGPFGGCAGSAPRRSSRSSMANCCRASRASNCSRASTASSSNC